MDIQLQFLMARNRGVPLLGIITPDPAATVSWIHLQVSNELPIVQWDSARGLLGVNNAAGSILMGLANVETLAGLKDLTLDSVNALDVVMKLPEQSVAIFLNLPSHWHHPEVSQAVWNCRDPFKSDRRTLVILAPDICPPQILHYDLVIFEEPRPTDEEIVVISRELLDSGGLPSADEATEKRICETMRGLPAFSVEQSIALSLDGRGVQYDVLWEHKKRQVENTDGLRFHIGGMTLDQMGGIRQVKRFMEDLMHGPEEIQVFVYVEEIEKMFAGASSDHANDGGVAKDALQTTLTKMEENKWTGMVCVGPPGSGKSLFSTCVAATYGRPRIEFDMGATRTALVGASEHSVRACFRMIESIAGKHAYWIATCNKYQTLPPELKRRFTDGIWYFGMPDEEELESIWAIQRANFSIPESDVSPSGIRYTGADVRNICRTAYRLRTTLRDAAQYIVPVSISDPGAINALEEAAHGRFLSASYPGTYDHKRPGAVVLAESPAKPRIRAMGNLGG